MELSDAAIQDNIEPLDYECESNTIQDPPPATGSSSEVANLEDRDIVVSESMPLATRRARRPRILPARFRDDIPQPLVQVPPPSVDLSNLPADSRPSSNPPPPAAVTPLTSVCHTDEQPTSNSFSSVVSQGFRTPRNAFRLLRQYFSSSPPSHDPEELVDFSDLCDGHGEVPNAQASEDSDNIVGDVPQDMMPSIPLPMSSFSPYPNESSFLLGEWYWNGGRQKSQADFRSLLDIVGRPDFCPEDVRCTNWHAIDAKLGENEFDEEGHTTVGDGSEEWLDDSGWRKSSITVSVPFHRRAKHPGPKDFFAGHLYHRSLVSVIKETLSDPVESQHFHYEPFALLWEKHPTSDSEDARVRVHGELYTSPIFLEVHRDLQEAPNEPNCTLQKVVVACMFLSDATHLTQFGTAKLWPGYLMFGNYSKYRRCRPSCNLCHHIAYFQGVSLFGCSLDDTDNISAP